MKTDFRTCVFFIVSIFLAERLTKVLLYDETPIILIDLLHVVIYAIWLLARNHKLKLQTPFGTVVVLSFSVAHDQLETKS